MADDRKQRILNHLKQSSGGNFYAPRRTPSPETPPPSLPDPTPVAPPVINRKQQIMVHLKQSSRNFGEFSLDTPEKRKQQIKDHLKKSLM